jgi:hypothetical protein
MTHDPVTAYPLCWPAGRPRTPAHERTWSRFGARRGGGVNADRVRRELLAEIERLDGAEVIISTNARLRRDGLPYSRDAVTDPGVAVYFTRRKRPMCFACDRWPTIDENLWAIVKTIEALRGVERWGSGDMVEQAFTGFTALPSPEQWWQVLGFDHSRPTWAEIEERYRALAMQHHPDRGGSTDAMARINAARDQGLEAIGA